VACVKLDRLARSVRHLTNLAAELEALGVDLIVLDQGIDTSCSSGRLLFHVLASIAEFERDLIRERTCAGLAAARRRGKRLGRKPAIRGSATFEIERGLRQGRSIRSLAQELRVDPHTIRRTVQRLGLRRAVA
jgi:DNA invertase Pin-like site-specific DNA recombinase